MSTILTAAGESLIARLQAEGKALIIDTMILANVPGQDHTQAIAPGDSVPAEAQIALRYAIPAQYRAYVNPNQVVYSAMLGSDMGDFVFNWQGLWCSEFNTLVAVATFPALEKRRYDEANSKTGNNLTRNFLLTFTGARELTGLTISADVWQLDFTVRLNGIDERERLSNFDIYGQAFFDGQGWLLQKTAEAYAFAAGLGYVGGIRAALAESLPLAAPEAVNLPQNVWLDICLKPTGSDRVAEASPMLTLPAAPLADSAGDETGLMHYRALVARIEADGSVTDLRPRKASGVLPFPGVATPFVAGTIRPDGITCYMQEDLLKVFLATPERAGLVRPDGLSLIVSDTGLLSVFSTNPPHRDVIQTSGAWTSSVQRGVRLTLVGAGGSGGNGGKSGLGGLGGLAGGNTSVTIPAGATLNGELLVVARKLTALGGSGGGGGGAAAEGGGGEAGDYSEHVVVLPAGARLDCTIGGGGVPYSSGWSTTTAGSNGTGTNGGAGGAGYAGGMGAPGASQGMSYINGEGSGTYGTLSPCGVGGRKHGTYGGGGPGGIGQHTYLVPRSGAQGGPGATDATTITVSDSTYPRAGFGGNGAIIIEYY